MNIRFLALLLITGFVANSYAADAQSIEKKRLENIAARAAKLEKSGADISKDGEVLEYLEYLADAQNLDDQEGEDSLWPVLSEEDREAIKKRLDLEKTFGGYNFPGAYTYYRGNPYKERPFWMTPEEWEIFSSEFPSISSSSAGKTRVQKSKSLSGSMRKPVHRRVMELRKSHF